MKKIFLYLFIALPVVSCEKREDILADKSIRIVDMPGDTLASMGGESGKEVRPFYTILFSLREQKPVWMVTASDSVNYLATDKWDLAFTGPYNSEIFLNNSRWMYNPGYGGPADRTAVIMVNQAYDDVNLAPDDAEFNKSDIVKIGWASSASSAGWFFYSLTNHICVPIKNRTYLLRLSDGKYAKLEVQNIYKGNPPVVTDLFWPAPYISFRYFVQEDGSGDLRTRVSQ
jgi:hypothetical protein